MTWSLILGLVAACQSPGAGAGHDRWTRAGSGPSVAQADDDWEYTIAPYVYNTDISGTVTAAGRVIPIEAEFSELLGDIEFGAQVFLKAKKGRHGYQADVTYLDLQSTIDLPPPGDLGIDTTMTLVGVDYTYSPETAQNLEFILGLRYFDLSLDIGIAPGVKIGPDVSALDPIIGAQGTWDLGDGLGFLLRGDIGGFGIDSELTWQMAGLFTWSVGTRWDLGLGYRMMGYDMNDSGTDIDIQYNGLLFGGLYSF